MAKVTLVSVPDPSKKIAAIKDLQSATGLGLKESKEIVDRMVPFDDIVEPERVEIELSDLARASLMAAGWTVECDEPIAAESIVFLARINQLERELDQKQSRILDLENRVDDSDLAVQGSLRRAEDAKDQMRDVLIDVLRLTANIREDESPTVGKLWFCLAEVSQLVGNAIDY